MVITSIIELLFLHEALERLALTLLDFLIGGFIGGFEVFNFKGFIFSMLFQFVFEKYGKTLIIFKK